MKKINKEYQKYANIMLIFMTVIVTFLLYIAYSNKGFSNIGNAKVEGGGGMDTVESKSFQPGDDEADMPGKLRWGRDF